MTLLSSPRSVPLPRREQSPATAMRFVVAPSSLGHVLVAANNEGITAVLIGDDVDLLVADVTARFADTTLSEGGSELRTIAAAVVAFIESPLGKFGHALAPKGTEFQRLVWSALRDIPAGATATYTEVAQRIGRPNSVRAVAAACGANPIAVIVPCHRVIGKDGALTGYRWGIERKRALLSRERTQ